MVQLIIVGNSIRLKWVNSVPPTQASFTSIFFIGGCIYGKHTGHLSEQIFGPSVSRYYQLFFSLE